MTPDFWVVVYIKGSYISYFNGKYVNKGNKIAIFMPGNGITFHKKIYILHYTAQLYNIYLYIILIFIFN